MTAVAVFTCRPNSHPFQERRVLLNEPVKIGRSVARSKPSPNNAIFDCKVLSRNHALLWYEAGKFYLQDTKSSNGTFINNQRLSKGSEESPAREVNSADIVQFGVDVMENSRRGVVTHGCIIATVTLYTPDGKEAKSSMNTLMPYNSSSNVQSQDLYQLSHYLQEALHREQMLEQKLAALQRIVANTQEASENGWQALIDEDRLLSRLEVLEAQLQSLSKAQPEDSIRKELVALQDDKHKYETTAKESLRRVLQEKLEAVRKLSDLERLFSNTEDELSHVKESSDDTQEELNALCEKHNKTKTEMQEMTAELAEIKRTHEEEVESVNANKRELQTKLELSEKREEALSAQIESLQADSDFTKQQLEAMKARLETIQAQQQHLQKQDTPPSTTTTTTLKDSPQGHGDAQNDILDKTDGDGQEDVTMQVLEDVNTSDELVDTSGSSTSHNTSTDLLMQYKTTIENMEKQLQEKQDKLDNLQVQLEQARLEAIQSIAQVSSLEEQLFNSQDIEDSKLDKALTQLTSRLEEAKRQNERSDELIRSLQEQVTRQLDESTDTVMNDDDGLRPEDSFLLTKLPDQLGNLHNHIGNSKDTLSNTAEKSLSMSGTQHDGVLEDSGNDSQELTSLQALLSQSSAKLKMTEEELHKLKNELSESQETTVKVLSENMQLKEQLMEAKQEAKDSIDHAVDLQEQLNKAEASAKEVKEQIIALRDQLLEEQETAKTNHKAAENLKSILSKEQETYRQKDNMLDDIKKQLLDAQQSAKQNHNEAKQLRDQVRELQSALEKEKRERIKQAQEANQASKAAKELQRQARKYEDETMRSKGIERYHLDVPENGDDTSDEEITPLTHLQLPADLNGLKEECSSLRKKIHTVEQELRKSRKDNSRLMQDFNRIQTQCKDAEAERVKLEDKENTWKKELKELRRDKDKSRKELIEINKENSRLKQKCTDIENKSKILNNQVTQLTEDAGARATKVTSILILSAIVLLFAILSRLFSGVFGSSASSTEGSISS
ncbi:uncharacterized protein LOC102809759 [Saccoglossus kowalevskii]|uniref:Sarcolemmal membrane-associated protein-like n=1 Tax=Saccoglossus kowalevskii TaxID=10224 RepID=A0ABM0M9K3_SACKO|nr:PREDICTED: sarcolemmal membrane-associated protein-like [Saccoglossus kowalevskii]